MLVDGYIRVSYVGGRGGASFISPDLQRERIEKWCALSGATLAKVHVELDESGGNPNRPLLQEALRRIEAGETQGLVVARMDRFGRSLVHSLQAIERIDKVGGTFVSVDDGLDLTTNTGRLVLRIMLSLAEFELDRIRDTWREQRRKTTERGIHYGSIPPTGYQRAGDGRLKLHREVAPFITGAFERRGDGEGIWKICRWLEANEVPNALGNLGWTTSVLARILRNRAYMGEAHRGEFRKANAHPAIVDAATWHRAQWPRQTKPSARPELLSGLVRCASCRMRLHPAIVGGRTYYSCGGRHARGKCPHPATVQGPLSEELVIAALRGRLARPAVPKSAELETAERRMAEAEAGVQRYRDNPALETTLGRERYTEGLRKRVDSVSRTAVEVAGLRSQHVERKPVNWDMLDKAGRKAVLREHLDCIFVAHSRLPTKERLFICWRGESPTGMPRSGVKGGPLLTFDQADCFGAARRRPLPRAFQPPWAQERLETELRAYVEQGAWMPDRVRARRDGKEDLYDEMCLQGGRAAWSRRIGAQLERANGRRRRTEAEVLAELRAWMGERTELPGKKTFAAEGQGSLYATLLRRGGLEQWASLV